jgi:superfamily II DNA/RNA helicase
MNYAIDDISGQGFKKFNIHPKLIESLTRNGYNKPFEIQEKSLPYTLEGR